MPTARLSSKSQIVIPAALRRSLGLKAGDLLEIRQEGDSLVVRKVHRSALEELEHVGGGMWRGQAEALAGEREEWDE